LGAHEAFGNVPRGSSLVKGRGLLRRMGAHADGERREIAYFKLVQIFVLTSAVTVSEKAKT